MNLLRIKAWVNLIYFACVLFVGQQVWAKECDKALSNTPPNYIELRSYYGSDALDRMVSRLQQIQGTITLRDSFETDDDRVSGEYFNEGGFNAYSDIYTRSIVINPKDLEIDQFIHLHHEAVHSTTDYKLRMDPENPQTSLAIIITREGEADSTLPMVYQNYYQIDEMKAYFKTSKLVSQVARKRRNLNVGLSEEAEEIAKDAKKKSELLAAVTFKILKQAEKVILAAIEQGDGEINIFHYVDDSPNVFLVELALPQASGAPILMDIPLYDPTVTYDTIEDPHKKILDVVRNAKKITHKYIYKLSII